MGGVRWADRSGPAHAQRWLGCPVFLRIPPLGCLRWGVPYFCVFLLCGYLVREYAPVHEEEVVTGSFLDCSINRSEARRHRCEHTQLRLGLYRIVNRSG